MLPDHNKPGPSLDLDIDHPIYFTTGASSKESSEPHDIKPNFSYLGNYGVRTFPNGIKMGFVTGDEAILNRDGDKIIAKLKDHKDIDFLVTYQWPKTLAQEAKVFLGNSIVDEIVRTTRPKYHLAVGSSAGKFYERAPFQWDDGTITRFISLSKFGSKEKWIYAFNYNIKQDGKVALPKNLTSNPFEVPEASKENITPEQVHEEESKKRKSENNTTQSEVQDEPTPKRQTITRKVVSPENCFFCLSNPKLESHMIISIGEHAYLTIAKGPLTRPTEKMKFSGHCLIIPIAHAPKIDYNKDSVPNNAQLLNEIMRYEVSLVKFFASFNLGTILFQINRSTSVHFHTQVFPIPVDFLPDFGKLLEKNAKLNNTKFSKNVKLDFKKYADECDQDYQELLKSNKDFISFTVINKSISDKTIYISTIESLEKSLDLQFGRRTLAYLLQSPKRIKWDKCQQSTQKETAETEAFKEAFKEYDFTMGI